MSSRIVSLPHEVLLLLAGHLHGLEDFSSLSSTCKDMRSILADTLPNTILRLAARQSSISSFPSSSLLVAATARELGNWGRQSTSNEETLATAFQGGFEALLELALPRCSLTMSRVRELYAMQYSIIYPVTNIIDQCVGQQWCDIPDFWSGGASDAASIAADASDTFFHLAVYGELFAPDIETYLNGNQTLPAQRSLTLDTRLEYLKYCVPDKHCVLMSEEHAQMAAARGAPLDPRRVVKDVGPYAVYDDRNERHSELHDDEPPNYYFDENNEFHIITTQNDRVDENNEPRTNPFDDDAFHRNPFHNNAFQNHFFDEDDGDDEFAGHEWFGQNNGFNEDNEFVGYDWFGQNDGFNEDNGSGENNAREPQEPPNDNNFALVWLLDSNRWRPHWQEARHRVGKDFKATFRDFEHFRANDPGNWRQRLWENTMLCQGLEGLGMILPGLQDAWLERIRGWRKKIAEMTEAPRVVVLGEQITYDYPYLFGELRICGKGFVGATQ